MPSIQTDCPSCKRMVRVPENLFNSQVRCPTCGHKFAAGDSRSAVESSIPPTASAPDIIDLVEPDASSIKLQGELTDRAGQPNALEYCPTCGARLARNARSCKRCGELLEERVQEVEAVEEDDRPWDDERSGYAGRRDAEPHRGSFLLIMGIMSLALFWFPLLPTALGIAAWVMGSRDLKKMRAREMDPDGESLTRAGFICGIVGVVLSSMCVIGWLCYIGFMATIFTVMRRSSVRPRRAPASTKKAAMLAPERMQDYLPPRMC